MAAKSLTNYTYGVNVVAVIIFVCLLVWSLIGLGVSALINRPRFSQVSLNVEQGNPWALLLYAVLGVTASALVLAGDAEAAKHATWLHALVLTAEAVYLLVLVAYEEQLECGRVMDNWHSGSSWHETAKALKCAWGYLTVGLLRAPTLAWLSQSR